MPYKRRQYKKKSYTVKRKPYRYAAKSKRKTYMAKRRKSYRSPRNRLIKGPRMPTSQTFTFKTCLEFLHTAIATDNNTLCVIKGNNAFDPFAVAPLSSTENCKYLSEWDNFYDLGLCNFSHMKFRIRDVDGDKPWRAMVIALRTSTVLNNGNTFDDLCDDPRVKFYPVKSNFNLGVSIGNYTASGAYKSSTKSMFKNQNIRDSDFSFVLSDGSGITVGNGWFYHLLIFSDNNGDLTVNKILKVEVEVYHTVKMTRRDFADV